MFQSISKYRKMYMYISYMHQALNQAEKKTVYGIFFFFFLTEIEIEKKNCCTYMSTNSEY